MFPLRSPKLTPAIVIAVSLIGQSIAAHKQASVPASPPVPIQDDQGTDKQPIAVKGTLTAIPPSPTPDEVKNEEVKAKDDHNLAIATIWLAVLTAALAVIASLQLWLFLRQLKLSEKAARDAETAAKAAKASADVLPKIERAYVFVDVSISDLERLSLRPPSYRFQITVRLTNHGKTPAILTRVRAYSLWSDVPPSQLIPTDRADRQLPPGLVIGSEAFFDVPLPQGVDGSAYDQLMGIETHLYTVGIIEYQDVMGASHHTSFCWHTYPVGEEVKISISPSSLNSFD